MAVSKRTQAIEQCASNVVGMLKFITQTSDEVRVSIMYLLDVMCDPDGDETVRQLSKFQSRLFSRYNEWPGPMEFRGVFCSLFLPADGIEADAVASTMAAEAEQSAIDKSNELKTVGAGESGMLLRQLLPGALGENEIVIAERIFEAIWIAQNDLWMKLCREYPVVKVFKRLSAEFAVADNARRAEILAHIDGRLTKAGLIGSHIANPAHMGEKEAE